MLIYEWRKFKGWSVLEFFLSGNEKTYVKELARKLKIGPSTAQHYLVIYNKEGLLEKESIGNVTAYRLVINATTTLLKRLYMLFSLKEGIDLFIMQNKHIITVALYGSSASGEYDKDSDVDLLVISQNKDLKLEPIRQLEKELGREFKIEVLSVGELRGLARKKDNFYLSVLNKHVILYGSAL